MLNILSQILTKENKEIKKEGIFIESGSGFGVFKGRIRVRNSGGNGSH